MITVIIAQGLTIILLFFGYKLLYDRAESEKEKRIEAQKEADKYQEMFFKTKEDLFKQKKKNSERLDKMAKELARVKQMSLKDVWKEF